MESCSFLACGWPPAAAKMTPVEFEPMPLRTGARSQRLRALGQSVLSFCAFPWRQFSWKRPIFQEIPLKNTACGGRVGPCEQLKGGGRTQKEQRKGRGKADYSFIGLIGLHRAHRASVGFIGLIGFRKAHRPSWRFIGLVGLRRARGAS